MNATNVHHDGADLEAQDYSGKKSFFCLPAEIRLMVWKMLLPGQRITSMRRRYGIRQKAIAQNNTPAHIKQSSHEPRWFLRPYRSSPRGIQAPVLLKICQESRDFALQHGSFVFQGSQVEDTGMWWNSSIDVLAFEKSWIQCPDLWASVGLTGLENIRHVALSSSVAANLEYVASYGHEDDRVRRRDPLAIGFTFREYLGAPHFVPEFFKHLVSLTVFFSSLRFDDGLDREIPGCSRLWQEGFAGRAAGPGCPSVTFQLGSEINVAVRQLKILKHLWLRHVERSGGPELDSYEIREDSIMFDIHPCIMYGLKDGVDPNEVDYDDSFVK